jgi:uncharacterized protein YecT (DUF1311 family)
MPDVDLSALSAPELRRLLDATRARGNATLAYQILQEMAARREARGKRAIALKRSTEPRVVAFDLGDPLEPEGEPPPEPPARDVAPGAEPEPLAAPARRARRTKAQRAVAAIPEPATAAAEEPEPAPGPRPRSVWDDDPPPPDETDHSGPLGLRLHPPSLEPARRVLARRRVPGAGFALGIAVGVGLGWWMADRREPPAPPAAPAAPAAALQIAAPEPPPAPVAASAPLVEPTPETPPEPAVEPSPDVHEASTAAAESAEAAAPAPDAAARPADACAAQPTPADRAICADPELQRLQRELRQAYAEALEAHEDRDLLRQRQLAWADARNAVTDPERLAQLYQERIRKLNSATAAARQQH